MGMLATKKFTISTSKNGIKFTPKKSKPSSPPKTARKSTIKKKK